MAEASEQEFERMAAGELDTEAWVSVQEILDHLYRSGDYATEITVRGVLKEVLDQRKTRVDTDSSPKDAI